MTKFTSKVKMPDPVAWIHVCRKKPELRGLLYEKSAPELASRGFIPSGLVTTTQAEAYTNERIKEALERALLEIELLHSNSGAEDRFQDLATEAIRALIPNDTE